MNSTCYANGQGAGKTLLAKLALSPLPLALPAPAAPHDRAIWLTVNVAFEIDCCHEVETYEGYAVWNEETQDWHDGGGMSIRGYHEATYHILGWRELAARAAEATEEEVSVSANVYYWDSEYRREEGRAGFFALLNISHDPTRLNVISRTSERPHPSQWSALIELNNWIVELIRDGTIPANHSPMPALATHAAPATAADERSAA